MSRSDLTQKDIERIIAIIEAAPDVSDFFLKQGSLEIKISRGGHLDAAAHVAPPSMAPPTMAPSPALPSPASVSSPPDAVEQTPATKGAPVLGASDFTIDAPMVGTFYRAPAPGEAPFVEVGQTVEGETILCIIEVMKLMNSISARRRGCVKRILVEDGDPVEFGQVLMVLEAID